MDAKRPKSLVFGNSIMGYLCKLTQNENGGFIMFYNCHFVTFSFSGGKTISILVLCEYAIVTLFICFLNFFNLMCQICLARNNNQKSKSRTKWQSGIVAEFHISKIKIKLREMYLKVLNFIIQLYEYNEDDFFLSFDC